MNATILKSDFHWLYTEMNPVERVMLEPYLISSGKIICAVDMLQKKQYDAELIGEILNLMDLLAKSIVEYETTINNVVEMSMSHRIRLCQLRVGMDIAIKTIEEQLKQFSDL